MKFWRKPAFQVVAGFMEILEILTVEPGTVPEQLRSSLSALSDSIYEFVSNPFFPSAKVVDTGMSGKADKTSNKSSSSVAT